MPIPIETFERLNDPDSGCNVHSRFDTGEGRLTLAISGQLGETNARLLTDRPLAGLEAGSGVLGSIIVDLHGLTYISSTGVGALSTMLLSSRDRGVKLSLARVNARIKSVFTLLGLWDYFDVLDEPPIPESAVAPDKTGE